MQRNPNPHPSLLALLDVATVVAALAAATVLRGAFFLEPLWLRLGFGPQPVYGAWTDVHTVLLLIQIPLITLGLAALGQYRAGPGGAPQWSFERLLAVAAGTHLTAIAVLYALRITGIPRTVLVLDFALLVLGLATWRALWTAQARRRLAHGQGLTHTLIVGTDPTAQDLGRGLIRASATHGRRLVGFLAAPGVPNGLEPLPAELLDAHGAWTPPTPPEPTDNLLTPVVVQSIRHRPRHVWAVLGTLGDGALQDALNGLHVDEVLVSTAIGHQPLIEVVTTSQLRGVDVHIVPEHFPELGVAHEATTLGDFTLMNVYRRPFNHLGAAAKRGLDLLGGLVGSLLAVPVILLAALAIKIEDRRLPVFYLDRRVGHKGRPFRMLKLTTMRAHDDAFTQRLAAQNEREGPWFKIRAEDDPRITRVGRFLRKYTLNEVPQFFNVLLGTMSLVGPRPPLPNEVADYVNYDYRYYRCLEAKPGMTSLWAVRARNDPSFERRVDLDMEYINHWSMWLDLKIMFLTFWTVVRSREE